MIHVKKIDLKFDLEPIIFGLNSLLEKIDWHPKHSQIGLTQSIGPTATESWYDATGSLLYEWLSDEVDENGLPLKKQIQKREDEFRYLVPELRDTVFERLISSLNERYKLGRIRLMNMGPRKCMTWHVDGEPRLHIPIVTNPGAHLVIENEAHHLQADGSVYIADTTRWHTAFNGGLQSRIHLVACVLKG